MNAALYEDSWSKALIQGKYLGSVFPQILNWNRKKKIIKATLKGKGKNETEQNKLQQPYDIDISISIRF